MAGALARALRKRDATSCSDSPTHFERSSGPLTARKLVRVSAARARAASVFEQPGGPYSSTPRGGRIPSCANRPACSSGHTTASCSACLSRPCPPTSPHDTAGTLISRPRSGPGRTCGSAASKSQRPTTRADSAATAAPAAPASAATPTRGDEASDRLAVATPVRPAPSAAPAAAAPAACCPAPCADAAPLRCREMARAIAWRVRASRSARTRPDVLPASLESCESVRECGTWARSASSSRRLSASSGTAASTSQSNRPARESKRHGVGSRMHPPWPLYPALLGWAVGAVYGRARGGDGFGVAGDGGGGGDGSGEGGGGEGGGWLGGGDGVERWWG
mmetsp:Transcript_4510/g.14641  ORF Transcript_4510/g.14641 Transcript_4510/m.14641 type:complete len:336 (+) Transcript_4510:1-1008(+)